MLTETLIRTEHNLRVLNVGFAELPLADTNRAVIAS
jgi:hypothetical protein